MQPLKLVDHMRSNSDRIYEGLMKKVRASEKCNESVVRVPADEHKEFTTQMYRDLTNWLGDEPVANMEQRYVAAGMRRAQQGVPFSHSFYGICIARDYLWEHIQEECLLEEPVSFWGGVKLLHSVNQFFVRDLYLGLVGYQKAGASDRASMHATSG